MKKKNTCLAYILLVFGGWAGLHHIYLRRDKQAFLYWCTFGGYFGLALLRDLYCLPKYVKEANTETNISATTPKSAKYAKNPPFRIVRFVAQILIGNSWCYLWVAAIPNEPVYDVSLKFLKYFGPLAASLGVWMVGDIGRIKANIRWCILGSYSIFPLTFINFDLINWCCVSSSLLLEWKGKEWRRVPLVRRAMWKRLLYLSMGWGLFCSLWASYIYFNGEISYKDGEKARMKDAIHNFFKSPMFLEFKKNMRRLYDDAREHGWLHAWKNLVELLDPLGEFHALKVLGLPNGASQEDISARFKNLTKEWHPDRHKSPESKLLAQEKFVEIAQSYEKLSSLKQRRSKKNKRSEDEL